MDEAKLTAVLNTAFMAAMAERSLDAALLAARPVDRDGRPLSGGASLQELADALGQGADREVTRSAARSRHAAAVKRHREEGKRR